MSFDKNPYWGATIPYDIKVLLTDLIGWKHHDRES